MQLPFLLLYVRAIMSSYLTFSFHYYFPAGARKHSMKQAPGKVTKAKFTQSVCLFLWDFARCFFCAYNPNSNSLKGANSMKQNDITIGSTIKEISMKLTPSGFSKPVIIDHKVLCVTEECMWFEEPRSHAYYNLDLLDQVRTSALYPDSFNLILRYGFCRAENVETFKSKMINEMHDVLVGYRQGLLSMQKHLNAQLPQEVDESIVIDWEKYACAAVSDTTQWVCPYVGDEEMDWSSTHNVSKTQFVQMEDYETGALLYASGLEGLEGAALINQMKRTIREHEGTPKYIIVSDEGFWNNKDGWCLAKADATRFVHIVPDMPIGSGVKLIPETEQHSYNDDDR